MPRQRRVLSSWRSSATGELVEGDLKIYVDEEDGSYELETNRDTIGVALGPDKNKKHTVITRILEPAKMNHFKGSINVGDVLLAINDQAVLDTLFDEVSKVLQDLVLESRPRKLKFINPKKYSLAAYRKKLALKLESQTDLFGFSCTAEEYLRDKEYNKVYGQTLKQRDEEWVEYLKSIGGAENLKPAGVFKPSKDLKKMCRRGIPVAYRCLIWQKISMSSLYKLQYPGNYYATLLSRVHELKPRVRDDIEKDVDRTFPEHAYFVSAGQGEQGLRRVLQAFAVHNQEIGYCQSLNFVAGMMLLFLPEEEAFWLLVTVVEKLLPSDYYTKSMVGTYVDQFVLAHIIKKYLPKIHKTLESHQLQLPLITVQWFMCIFVNTLRPEVTLRVWDMFLNEGSKVIFRIAGGLFKLHESRLLAVKDASDLFTVLRSIGKDVYDADRLIAAAYKSYRTLPLMKKVASKASNSASSPVSSDQLQQQQQQPQHPSPSGFLTVSPRLSNKSWLGAVPNELQGLGLAHTGPADAYDKMIARYSTKEAVNETELTDLAAEQGSAKSNVDDVLEQSNEELVKEFQAAAVGISDTLIADESIQEINISTEPDQEVEEVVEVDNDPIFAQPELIMSRWSEAHVGNHMFSAQYEKKLKQKRVITRTRDGELDFKRYDIALWRSSFRPALEERYERMESARIQWRKQSFDGGVSQRKSRPNLSVSTSTEGVEPEQFLGTPIRHSTPIRLSRSGSSGGMTPGLATRSPFTEVLRRSSSKPIAIPVDEAIITAATYSIDQEIEVDDVTKIAATASTS